MIVVPMTLNNGDINKLVDDFTALYMAVREGLLKVVKLLLENGANINKGDNNGRTTSLFSSESFLLGN